jgi:hypothetical protein
MKMQMKKGRRRRRRRWLVVSGCRSGKLHQRRNSKGFVFKGCFHTYRIKHCVSLIICAAAAAAAAGGQCLQYKYLQRDSHDAAVEQRG